MTDRNRDAGHAPNRGPGGCVPWEEHKRVLTNCERFHVDEEVHDKETARLRDENQTLRAVLLSTLDNHATDEDHPCEACRWTLDEWPLADGGSS